jgi:hypothetical protein
MFATGFVSKLRALVTGRVQSDLGSATENLDLAVEAATKRVLAEVETAVQAGAEQILAGLQAAVETGLERAIRGAARDGDEPAPAKAKPKAKKAAAKTAPRNRLAESNGVLAGE